ncbi:MAG: hypothetical protein ACXQS2_05380 [Methermicoccaceae archaeon]
MMEEDRLARLIMGVRSLLGIDSNNRKQVARPKRKVYRLRYAESTLEKPIEEREEKSKREKSAPKKRRKKKKETKKERVPEDKEDVERAVELVKEAAMYLMCPFCKARLVDEIEYLLTYHYKSMLVESGINPKEVDMVFKERYEGVVKRRVESIKKELGVGDFEYKQAVAEKAKALIGKS